MKASFAIIVISVSLGLVAGIQSGTDLAFSPPRSPQVPKNTLSHNFTTMYDFDSLSRALIFAPPPGFDQFLLRMIQKAKEGPLADRFYKLYKEDLNPTISDYQDFYDGKPSYVGASLAIPSPKIPRKAKRIPQRTKRGVVPRFLRERTRCWPKGKINYARLRQIIAEREKKGLPVDDLKAFLNRRFGGRLYQTTTIQTLRNRTLVPVLQARR